ncbi:MAG: hypothetical protein R3B67_14410 [Phycisphaerales bacterium]
MFAFNAKTSKGAKASFSFFERRECGVHAKAPANIAGGSRATAAGYVVFALIEGFGVALALTGVRLAPNKLTMTLGILSCILVFGFISVLIYGIPREL